MEYYKNLSLKDIKGEIWKDIPNYEGKYQASSFGRIKGLKITIVGYRGCKNTYPDRIMSQGLNSTGYCATRRTFVFEGKKTNLVHRLVALAFLPNPLNLPEVNHIGINGDKTDNRVESLVWSTHEDNIRHANDVLDVNGGLKHFRSKFTEKDVLDIFYSKEKNRELAKRYGVSHSVIGFIKTKKSYKKLLESHDNGSVFNSRLTKDLILSIHSSELPYSEISNTYKVSNATVHLIKTGKKYSDITGGGFEKKPFVSKEKILDIRQGGLSTKDLMAKHGLSKSLINKIKSGRAYSWI